MPIQTLLILLLIWATTKNCETVIEELSANLACDEEFKAKDRQGKEELLFKRALVALAR